ncbi:hypothetical protein OTC26_023080 [Streptomyces tirandamycinicus]|uniref:hypothetical protein n=1 Tax=Streptomyces tirandamycinicus TaxID=2174846 RepID=UPI00227026B8|nr:hypothetical protein [Streptomyces tirandamycinicus]MCY0981351.1 hypothetical protein [Streptomyces tirandamycinicus]
MAPGDGGGGAAAARDLERGVGALKRFQERVDNLLAELENGAGGTKKVAAQAVSRGSFSGANMPFAEADGFYTQYNRVHKALTSLSKSLGDQIELLRIGVHGADVGFDNVEEDLRSRFHRIRTRLDQEREAHEKRDKPQGDAPGQNADVKDVDTEDMG